MSSAARGVAARQVSSLFNGWQRTRLSITLSLSTGATGDPTFDKDSVVPRTGRTVRRRGFFRAGIGLTGAVLLLLAGAGHAADEASNAEARPIRICAEYTVTGPGWQPDEDDLYTEVAAGLMRSVTADRRDVVVFGFEDTYDATQAARPPCDLVQADYLLRSWKHRNSDRSFQVTSELQARTGSASISATSESGERNRLAALLAESVAELLDTKLNRRIDTKLIDHFGNYSLEGHHLELARSRMLRLLGRHYGEPEEEALFDRSRLQLEEAVRSREREGQDASYFEAIETLASSFRSLNLGKEEGERFYRDGKEWIARAAGVVRPDHPEVAIWEGIYSVFDDEVESGIAPFDRAVDDGPDDRGVPTREGRLWASAYLMRGLYHERELENPEAAYRDFRQAAELNPTLLRARSYVVRTSPDLPTARAEWNRIGNEIRPYGLATYQLAWKTWKSGDAAGALSLIDDELIGRTDDAFYDDDAFVLKARIQTGLGRWADAETTLIDGLRQIAGWTEPSRVEIAREGAREIANIVDEFGEAIERGSGKRRFSRIQDELTTLLLERQSTTALEQSLLALVAAHAGDDGTAVEIVGSLEQQFPAPRGASDSMLHIAIARVYDLLRRDDSAVVVQAAISTRRD
jgi:tetratricopeptide (TPR) repeat protein